MGGGGNYMSTGTALSGDIVGGIGSLIAAENYKRPRLQPATGYELRLRQLAQDQLLGGGQQLLGATALYNQMAPILMGQLPGMHYVPPTADMGQPGTGAASSSPMANYQTALANFQRQQALKQQLTGLNAQIKGLQPGAQRRGLRQTRKGVRQQLKQLPSAADLERQEYMGATTGPGTPAMYNISQGTNDSFAGGQPSLSDIHSLLGTFTGGQNPLDLYRGQGTGAPPAGGFI